MSSPLKTAGDKTHAIAERNAASVHFGESREEGRVLAQRLLDGTLADDSGSTLGALEDSQVFDLGSFAESVRGLTSPTTADLAATRRRLGNGVGGAGSGSGLTTADSWTGVERSRAAVENYRRLAEQAFEKLRVSLSFSGFPVDENMQRTAASVRGISLEQFLSDARRRNTVQMKPLYKSNMEAHERNALFDAEIETLEAAQLLEPDVDVEVAVRELGQRLGLIAPDGGWKPRCGCEAKLDLIKQQCRADERRIARAKFMTAFTKEIDRNIAAVDEVVSKCNEAEEVRMREIGEIRERQYAMISKMQAQKQTIERLKKRIRDAGLRMEEDPTLERVDTVDLTSLKGYKSFMEKEKTRAKQADIPRKRHKVIKRRMMQLCANSEKALMAKFDHDGYVDPYIEEYLEKIKNQKRGIAKAMQTLTDDELLLEHGIAAGSFAGGRRSASLASLIQNVALPRLPAMTANLSSFEPPPPPPAAAAPAAAAPAQPPVIDPIAAAAASKAREAVMDAISNGQKAEDALTKLVDGVLQSLGRLEGLRTRVMGSVASLAPADSEIERECAPLFGFANNGAKEAIDSAALELKSRGKTILTMLRDLVAAAAATQQDLQAARRNEALIAQLQQQVQQLSSSGGLSSAKSAPNFAQHVQEVRAGSGDADDVLGVPPKPAGGAAGANAKRAASKPSLKKSGSVASPAPKRSDSTAAVSPAPAPAADDPKKTSKRSSTTVAKKASVVAVDNGGGGEDGEGGAQRSGGGSLVDFSAVRAEIEKLRFVITTLRDAIVGGTRQLLENDRIDAPPQPTTTPAPPTIPNVPTIDSDGDASLSPLLSPLAPNAGAPPMVVAASPTAPLLTRLERCSDVDGILALVAEWRRVYLPAAGKRIVDPDATIPLVDAARTVRRATEAVVNACTRVGFTFPMEVIVDVDTPVSFDDVRTVGTVVQRLRKCEEHLNTVAKRVKKQFPELAKEEQRPLGDELRRVTEAARAFFASMQQLLPDMPVDSPLRSFLDVTASYERDQQQKRAAVATAIATTTRSSFSAAVTSADADDDCFDGEVIREHGAALAAAVGSAETSLREYMRVFFQRQEEEIERRAQRTATQLQTKMVEEADKQAIRETQRMQRVRQEVEDRIRAESERMRQTLREEEERLEAIRRGNEQRVRESEEQTQRAIALQEQIKVLRTRQATVETDEAIEREAQRLADAQEALFNEMLDSLVVGEHQNRAGVVDVEDSQRASFCELEAAVRCALLQRGLERVISEGSIAGGGGGTSPPLGGLSPNANSHRSTPGPRHIIAVPQQDEFITEDLDNGIAEVAAEETDEENCASTSPLSQSLDQSPATFDVLAAAASDGSDHDVSGFCNRGVQVCVSAPTKSRGNQISAPSESKSVKRRAIGLQCVLVDTPISQGAILDPARNSQSQTPRHAAVAIHMTTTATQTDVIEAEALITEAHQTGRKGRGEPSRRKTSSGDVVPTDSHERAEHRESPSVRSGRAREVPNELRGLIGATGLSAVDTGDGQGAEEAARLRAAALAREAFLASHVGSEDDARLPMGTVCAATETDLVPPTLRCVSYVHVIDIPGAVPNLDASQVAPLPRQLNARHEATALSSFSEDAGTQTTLTGTSGWSGSSMPSDGRSGDVFFATLDDATAVVDRAPRTSVVEKRHTNFTEEGPHEAKVPPRERHHGRGAAESTAHDRVAQLQQEIDELRAALRRADDRNQPHRSTAKHATQTEVASVAVAHSSAAVTAHVANDNQRTSVESLAEVVAKHHGREKRVATTISSLLDTFGRVTGMPTANVVARRGADSAGLDVALVDQQLSAVMTFLDSLPRPGAPSATGSKPPRFDSDAVTAAAATATAAGAALSRRAVGTQCMTEVTTHFTQTDLNSATDGAHTPQQRRPALETPPRKSMGLPPLSPSGIRVELDSTVGSLAASTTSPPAAAATVAAAPNTMIGRAPPGGPLLSPIASATAAGGGSLTRTPRASSALGSLTPHAAAAATASDEMWERKVQAALERVEEERLQQRARERAEATKVLEMHRLLVDTLRELVKRVHRDERDTVSGAAAGLMAALFTQFKDPFSDLQGVFTAPAADVVRFDTTLLTSVHRHLRAESSLAKKRISLNLEQAVLQKRLEKMQEARRNREFATAGREVPQVAAFLDRQEQKLRKAIEAFNAMKEEIARERQQQFFLPMSDIAEAPQLPMMLERRRVLAAGARAHVRTPVENVSATRVGPVHVGDFEHSQHPANNKRVRPLPEKAATGSAPQQPSPDLTIRAHSKLSAVVADGAVGIASSPHHHPNLSTGAIDAPHSPWQASVLQHQARAEPEEKPIDIILRTAVLPARGLPALNAGPLQNARAPPVKHLVVPRRTTQVQPDRDFFASFLHGHAASLAPRSVSPPKDAVSAAANATVPEGILGGRSKRAGGKRASSTSPPP